MSIATVSIILFAVFFALLFFGVPISISILVSSLAATLTVLPWDQATFITMQKMNSGVDSFSLLAIPLFVLAGNIMNNGGIASRLINFARLLVGRIPGSLAHTNVVGNMLFGALSGSAVAAAAAIGGTMYKEQRKAGYDPGFAASANIASAPAGLLIPPTSAFIVFSTIAGGVSISQLFMAGVVPGILMGLGAMVVILIYAKRNNMKGDAGVALSEAGRITLQAIPSLLMIVIVIGGIVEGIFTATEGAGISVLYSAALSLIYRSLSWADMKDILRKTTATSGMVLFLIAASSAMSWVMAFSGIPAAISEAILGVTENKVLIMLLMLVVLVVVGTFMDITPAILIFTPIFLPMMTDLGVDVVHFGVILVFAMCIGTMTPPVGSVLFVTSGITGVSIEKIFPKLIPFFVALLVLLVVVTFVPQLSLGLPEMMGLMD